MRKLLGALVLALVTSLAVVLPAESADAAVRSYCNRNHQLWASVWGTDFDVSASVIGDPTPTHGRVSYTLGYLRCEYPQRGVYYQPRYITVCYTHTGFFDSVVLQGIRSDITVTSNYGLMNKVTDFFLETHPPVNRGDHYCDTKWFISRKWVKAGALPRWRVHFEEATATRRDDDHWSPTRYLNPARDHMLTPFRKIA